MQEMNDLKNLVIQTLESQGVLSQLRAQIRSSVFRVIETQEKSSKSSQFTWENPLCQKIYESVEGPIALELIYEMLEFFKMDYTMNVFIHECNIKETTRRESLAEKIHLKKNDAGKPLLMCLISEALNGPGPSSRGLTEEPKAPAQAPQKPVPVAEAPSKAAPQQAASSNKEWKTTTEPPAAGSSKSGQGASENQAKPKPAAKTFEDAHIRTIEPDIKMPPKKQEPALVAQKPVETQKQKTNEREEKKEAGFNSNLDSGWHGSRDKPEESGDYEENFDEEVDEDLQGESGELSKSKHNGTGEEVVMSQSVGMDMSVDSMCLEEYDYYEDAEGPMA